MANYTVDDIMPFEFDPSTDRYRLIFNSNSGIKSIGHALIEKAWAKARGSYLATDVGFIENAMRFLTGIPVTRHSLAKFKGRRSKLWRQLNEWHKAGFFLSVATAGNDNRIYGRFSLPQGHAFEIVDIFEMTSQSSFVERRYRSRKKVALKPRKLRMIALHNPWGFSQFRGKWNMRDDLSWTSHMVNQIPAGLPKPSECLAQKKDACSYIYMEMRDFQEGFTSFQVAHYHSNYAVQNLYKQTRVKGSHRYKFKLEIQQVDD